MPGDIDLDSTQAKLIRYPEVLGSESWRLLGRKMFRLITRIAAASSGCPTIAGLQLPLPALAEEG